MIIKEVKKTAGEPHKCSRCGEIECRDVGAEYGGLAGGGDYDVHQCSACGKRSYIELPD